MSDFEDEVPTPKRQPTDSERRRHLARFPPTTPVIKSSEDRDLAHLRASYPRGVPIQPPPDPKVDTSPFDLGGDPSDEDLEIVRGTRRSPDASVTALDLARLVAYVRRKIAKLTGEVSSQNTTRANQLLELLNRPPDEATQALRTDLTTLVGRVDDLAEFAAAQRRLARWALGAAIGSVLTVATFLYARGFSEGSASTRLDHVEKNIDEIHQDVRALGRRSSITPGSSPVALSTTKDTP